MSAICVAGGAHPLVAHVARRRWTGLGTAATIAVGLHVALFVLRPGGSVRSHVEPSSAAPTAMAIRILRPMAPVQPAAPAVESSTGVTTELRRPPADNGANDPRTATAAPTRTDAESPRRAGPPADASIERAPHDAREAPGSQNAQYPPAVGPSLPAAPDYALGIRLDPGPRPLEDIDPDYPDPYLREGTVVLRLLISETGHVDNVAVVRSQPPGVFDDAALEAFGRAKFAPGLAAGTPVKSQITVEVQFVPINRGARVSGRTY